MNFCCHVTQNCFESRNNCGSFLFAAMDTDAGKVRYYVGYTAAHKKDYTAGVGVCHALRAAMQSEGISNFKPLGYRNVNFCSWCGASLSEFYGADGGELRDDDFLRKLKE